MHHDATFRTSGSGRSPQTGTTRPAAWDDDPVEASVRWLSEQEQVAWRAYLRASRELDVALERDLHCHGISLSEYELISMLSEREGGRLRMSAIAELIVQSRSRVTHTAGRLERRGWVRRTPAPDDGRGVVLELTEDGWDALHRLSVVHVESVRRHFVDVMSPEQFAGLGEAMAAVRAAYDADPTTPDPTQCPTMDG